MIRKLSGILLLSIAAFSLACAAPARAASLPDIETDEEMAANDAHAFMLRSGRYEQMDAELNRVQQEYEEGKRDDISVLHFFRAFSDAALDPALEKNYDGWVKAYPKSYAARLARGIYFRRRADTIYDNADNPAELKPQQKSDLKRLTGAALADSKAAAALTAKPLLAYSNMVKIGWITGDRALSKEMVDLAGKTDPGNYVARINYMPVLETRWGGSLEKMLAFREETAKALRKELLLGFDEIIEYERSWHDWQENNANHDLLKAGQYKQLDERMSLYQKEYEEGKRDDASMDRLYIPFRSPDPDMEPRYQAWIEAYPQSYAAHQARAEYYLQLGLKARGNEYMNKTSETEVSGMHRYMGMAMDDDKAAIALTPKPILTYQNIMEIAQFTGADDLCREMMELAIKADPGTYIVRNQYLNTLQGRWGGSLEMMEKFVEESRQAGLSKSRINYFEDQLLEERIWQRYNANERNETIGQLQTGL